jgi:hypothetical protein
MEEFCSLFTLPGDFKYGHRRPSLVDAQRQVRSIGREKMAALPANPLCPQVIIVPRGKTTTYRVHVGGAMEDKGETKERNR